MQGFFTKTEVPTKSTRGVLSCVSCGLYKSATSPKIAPYGNFRKGIMVIGEAPGEEEDRKGRPWQGKVGRALQQRYQQLDVDLFEDCISLNAVNCRPVDKKGNNRAPTEQEIACCRSKVLAAVKTHQPKVIILHGNAAVSSLITGHRWRWSQSGIFTWRGWTIPDREYNAWVCPTFHPSFIERQEPQSEAAVVWERDLRQAFAKLEDPFPTVGPEEDCVVVSHDVDAVLRELSKQQTGMLAFDIETTGIKPYNKADHRIVSISFCNEPDRAYAIPFPDSPKQLRLLKRILENPKVSKVAANMKFEDNWLVTLHGFQPRPWGFDTMQAAHILDNRPGITGLKFQAYVQFGTPNYDEEISAYLKSRDSNTPNRIMELTKTPASFNKLLLYNGMDSLLTYRLAVEQMREMKTENLV